MYIRQHLIFCLDELCLIRTGNNNRLSQSQNVDINYKFSSEHITVYSLFMIKTNTDEKRTLKLDIKQWTADLYVQHYINGRETYRSCKPPYRHNARFVWLSRKPRILGVQFRSHPNSVVARFNTKYLRK